jgi:hypothetical protein
MWHSDAQKQRKVGVSYICHFRWLMQMIGLIAGIVTPVLGLIQRINPNACHCGLATQLLQTCMLYFYITLAVSCTLEAVFQVRHRGRQSCIQVFFVTLFMLAAFVYVLFQALLIAVSMYKICTGTVGGWAVTARNVQKPLSEEAVESVGDLEAQASKDQPTENSATCQEESHA